MLIDVFITCSPEDYRTLAASVFSALTQTIPVRVVLYLDGINQNIVDVVDTWFRERDNIIVIEKEFGPSGNAGKGRQWYFDWEEKGDWVKFLDADDILLYNTIEIMNSYINNDTDAVFCPLSHISSNRYFQIIPGLPEPNKSGAGSMMLSKKMINELKEKVNWIEEKGDDEKILKVIQSMNFNIVTTSQDFLYIYMK